MNGHDIMAIGYEKGPIIKTAIQCCNNAGDCDVELVLRSIYDDPANFTDDEVFGKLAQELVEQRRDSVEKERLIKSTQPKPYTVFGRSLINDNAIAQMDVAMRLPVAVNGAIMPDGHLGYGLPIGGVLACDNAVIPNAVGDDIACRMRMTIFPEVEPNWLDNNRQKARDVLISNTMFGDGRDDPPSNKRGHAVLDDPTWDSLNTLKRLKDKAWRQLGSSGSGNHFVEFGIVDVGLSFSQLKPGKYVALLSHSGSRGPGAAVAKHYRKIAEHKLPRELSEFKHLAWLDMDSEEGAEYWTCMELMGQYASANHQCIHEGIASDLGFGVEHIVENHHNFAWVESHDGRPLVVHRKGATPASFYELGIIPGSMADSCYVVMGLGDARSLRSASHGAGRLMSRTAARNSFSWDTWRQKLIDNNIDLISSGIDEVPGCYKNINTVMDEQRDLVMAVGEFRPRIVRMCDE